MRVYVPQRLEVKFFNILRESISKTGGNFSGWGDNIFFITKEQHKLVKDVCYVLK